MKPNAALAAILAGPDAMTRPRQLRRAGQSQIAACAPLRAMRAALDALEDTSTEAIFAALAPQCDDAEWVSALLADLVGSCADDTLFCPPLRGGHDALSNDNAASNLVLLDHPLAVVSLHSWVGTGRDDPAQPAVVQVTGKPALFRGIGGQGATFQIWSCDPLREEEDLARKTCRFERDATLDSSTLLRVDGRRQAMAIRKAARPFAALQIRDNRNVSPYVLEFATETGRLVNVLPARVEDSRVLMMMGALRRCRRASEATLTPYLEHPNFAIRWQAMRELIACTGTRSRGTLERFLARERNPVIQRAGVRTVEMLARLGEQ